MVDTQADATRGVEGRLHMDTGSDGAEFPGLDQRAEAIYERLLRRRVIFVRGPLDESHANLAVAQLLYLDRLDAAEDINLYINCPEGDLRAALSVYDATRFLRSDLRTVCLGLAADGAALLLAAGTTGKRAALRNARIMLRRPRSEIRGTVAEIDVRARELLRLRHQVNEILALHTGQPLERIERDTERELWLSAEEAREYGLIDEILTAAPPNVAENPPG